MKISNAVSKILVAVLWCGVSVGCVAEEIKKPLLPTTKATLIPYQFNKILYPDAKDNADLKKSGRTTSAECLALFEKIRTGDGVEIVNPVFESTTPDEDAPLLKPYAECKNMPDPVEVGENMWPEPYHGLIDSGDMNFKLYRIKLCDTCKQEEWLYAERMDKNPRQKPKAEYLKIDTENCEAIGSISPAAGFKGRREAPVSDNGTVKIGSDYYTWAYDTGYSALSFELLKLISDASSAKSVKHYCNLRGTVKPK